MRASSFPLIFTFAFVFSSLGCGNSHTAKLRDSGFVDSSTCTSSACADAGNDSGPGCPAERRCGATACCSANEQCVVDECRPTCPMDQTACGSGETATCCDSAHVCYLGACVEPGPECHSRNECASGTYCEPTLMHCLPLATGSACEVRPPEDLLSAANLKEEWSWNGDSTVLTTHDQVMMTPVVANLTDDDGDGDIDEDDIPDVVFNSFENGEWCQNGVLRAISGRDGSRIWPTSDPAYRTTGGGEIAIADVDPTSPGPEIMTCSESTCPNGPSGSGATPGHLLLLSAQGTLLRRFNEVGNEVPCGLDTTSVADMNGDGTPEIVVRYIIAHADGTIVRRVREYNARLGPFTALVNVDADADLELIGPNGLYELDGTKVWERRGRPGQILPVIDDVGWVAVADLDMDHDPEIVSVTLEDHAVRVLDPATGADVWGPIDINPPEVADIVAADPTGPRGGGPPTIANVDDDAFPEIAFAGGFAYAVFNHDGSRLWYYPTEDRTSRRTGSSVFDFNGDGVAEVIYNDEKTFRIFVGRNGNVLRDMCNTSGTLAEYPIIVDVDNDNQAEVVLMRNNYASHRCLDNTLSGTGIRVFGHENNQWVRTRRIWNQHTYHITNINEDGTVPLRETPHWAMDATNSFRQNVFPEGLFTAADVTLSDLQYSRSSCPDSLQLSVNVVNRGSAGLVSGLPITLYQVIAEGQQTIVAQGTTARALLPGESERVTFSPSFPVGLAQRTAAFRFVAVANDPNNSPLTTFAECRTDNNISDIIVSVCETIQ